MSVREVLLVEADVYQYSGWQSIWQLGTTRAGQFHVVSDVFAAILDHGKIALRLILCGIMNSRLWSGHISSLQAHVHI
jgi:hypothetical protein